jgi:hypothetical protein
MAVPGGEAHEICASDLAGVRHRSGLVVPVYVFALGRGSPAVLGRVLDGMDVVLCAVSSSHAASRGLLTWLLCCMCIGCGWRVQDV